MGYTTDFEGSFQLDRPLSSDQSRYLTAFAKTRRMKRDAKKTATRADPKRMVVRLPVGPQGAYFVGEGGMYGQTYGDDVVGGNTPPKGQPGLWCQWIPTDDRHGIVWDCGEKFYEYTAWLAYIIEHFLEPWGFRLDGEVTWQGESPDDIGKLTVKNNMVYENAGRVVYE